jgi:hypothetical protein
MEVSTATHKQREKEPNPVHTVSPSTSEESKGGDIQTRLDNRIVGVILA